jgi:tetratricopeptide (TPR) repeat protein
MRLRGLGAALVLASAAVGAWAQDRKPAARHKPDAAAKPATEQVERAAAALAKVDERRLQRDRVYAAETLRHLDALDGMRLAPAAELALLGLRVVANVTLEREPLAREAAERMLAMRPDEARHYAAPLLAALLSREPERLAAVIVAAGRVEERREWPLLLRLFEEDMVWSVVRQLRASGNMGPAAEMAEALLRIGWPGEDEAGQRDAMRMIALKERVDRGDRAAAAAMARDLVSVRSLLQLLLLRRYEELTGSGDPVARIEAAQAREDAVTAARLAAGPGGREALLRRVQFLRSADRHEEALALLAPHIVDPQALAAESEDGMWLANEAAYILLHAGRAAETVTLMREALATDLDERPYLVSASINLAAILYEAGRPEEALAHAKMLADAPPRYASLFGRMWIWSAAACALGGLDRAHEAGEWLELLAEHSEENGAAHLRALLCLGDEDGAEAVLLRRLEGREADDLIVRLQDYSGGGGMGPADVVHERLMRVRARPAVSAAISRIGRVMRLPLSRTYYGDI